jgi:hypothetical protein
MPEQRAFVYRVLKYFPNPLQDMHANVGVILVEVGGGDAAYADVKLTSDWRVAKVLDSAIDTEYVSELQKDIRERLRSTAMDCTSAGTTLSQRDWIKHVLDDWLSNAVQVSESIPIMSADPEATLRALVTQYCVLLRREGLGRPVVGRRAILRRMKREFESCGVWGLLHKSFPLAGDGHKGDRLKIDYGYRHPKEAIRDLLRTDQVFRMFHAVSLKQDLRVANLLALRFADARGILEEEKKARVELTAIVEHEFDERDDDVMFALDTFEAKGVIVQDVTYLPGIADQARRELAA